MAEGAKTSRKKNHILTYFIIAFLVIVIGVWLYFLLDIGNIFHDITEGPEYARFITAPGVYPSLTSFTLTRTTVLDFDGVCPVESEFEKGSYYLNRTVQVTDTYTLQNHGDTSVSFEIFYPVSGYDSEQDNVTVTIDAAALENWWGMCSFVAVDTENYEQVLGQQLCDGAAFATAFPNWPERGTPYTMLDNSDHRGNAIGSKISYAFAYYLQTVTIPAGDSIEVRATYPLNHTGKLLFPTCYQAIPCESHTLIIENAGYVKLEDQNLGISDLSGTVRLDLDPTRTDYFMEFNVEMP